jgi:Coenzyme F420-reducing hydrogenase, delta subunit
MVILSVGIQPRKDSGVIQRLFNLSKTSDGFFMESNPILKPVDAPTGGIFFAGCAEGPKNINMSVMEAGAAASHAAILMGKGKVTVEAITPEIIEDMCIGCGLCEKVCPFNAIFVNEETKKAEVIEAACSGCGTCGAECPQGAIISRHFTDDQIYAQIDAATDTNADKKIVAFCCNWCSYAGADNAGVSRIQYPTSVRIIRVMCSGRIRPQFIEHAFKRGVAAVLVAGCHLGDCHYIDANYQTEKRVNRLWRKMEKQGLDKERLQLVWVSAAEGEKFAEKIREMQKIIDNVSKEAIEKAKAVFSKKKKKKKKKVDEIATA